MRLDWIRCFMAVVVTGSFSEAAEKIYVTQATISKHIIALEKEMGVRLFNRAHRRVELTAGGRALLPYAERCISLYNEMHDALAEFRIEDSTSVTVGSFPVMAHYGITTLITSYRKQNPEFTLQVEEKETSELLTEMENGRFAMAFLRSEQINPLKYHILPIVKDHLVVVLYDKHPLAEHESLSLKDLSNEDFLSLGKGTKFLDLYMELCKPFGYAPRIIYTSNRIENLMGMISQNMGISLLMDRPARCTLCPGVKIIPLVENVISKVALVRLRSVPMSFAASRFWMFVRSCSNNISNE